MLHIKVLTWLDMIFDPWIHFKNNSPQNVKWNLSGYRNTLWWSQFLSNDLSLFRRIKFQAGPLDLFQRWLTFFSCNFCSMIQKAYVILEIQSLQIARINLLQLLGRNNNFLNLLSVQFEQRATEWPLKAQQKPRKVALIVEKTSSVVSLHK